MASVSRFELLRQLAERARDESRNRYAQAQRGVEEAQKKLQLLQHYQQDYQNQFEQSRQQGMSIAGWQNYQQFIARLQQAVEQQSAEVQRLEQQCLKLRQAWAEEEKKLKGYEVLCARERQQQQVKENRKEQKIMDEFASVTLHHKRHHHE